MITIRSSTNVSEPLLTGFEATLTTPSGVYEFSSDEPVIDPTSPFGGGLFGAIASPRSRFRISSNLAIEQQMFVSDEASDIAISWELQGQLVPAQLIVRPYFAGCASRGYRDIGFHFESEQEGGRLVWLPTVRGPKIIADTNGRYTDEPLRLAETMERADAEQLIAPGWFEFQLSHHPSVLILSIDGAKTQHQKQVGAFLAGLLQNEIRVRPETVDHAVAA
jgi:hypothetical protein